MKKINLIIFGILFHVILFGQENTANVWYFGDYAGINFNTGIPVPLTNSAMYTGEGCATLCDVNGNLLFYTDGSNVWNKNHQLMPNGTGLMGNNSASQSAIIAPYPQSDSLYIVFTVDARENNLANGLRYSIIDISLDGGLGDITTNKNTLLHTPVSEKITSVIKNNQYDYWIIAHEWGSNDFLVYSITNIGVNTTPVTSSIGTVHTGGNPSQLHAIGCMKASLNAQKIAVANYRNLGFFELFDFNDATGILSNVQTSPSSYYRPYGVEFSPNGEILYGSIDGGEYNVDGKIYQFDLTSPTPMNSATLIGNSPYHTSSIQLGTNAKIYVSIQGYAYLGVIDNPNNFGTSCNFIHDAVYLDGANCIRGLPSLFYHKGFQFFTGSEIDTAICDGDSIYLENVYQTVAETYYDTLNSYLGWDSIVNTHLTILSVLPPPTISELAGVLTSSTAPNYQWYFNGNIIVGAITQNYQPLVTGNYQVVVDNGNGCESLSDNYYFIYTNINEIEIQKRIFPNPTTGKIYLSGLEVQSIDIYDITGLLIYSGKANSHDRVLIDISNNSNGIYFIKVETIETTYFSKIIKQ